MRSYKSEGIILKRKNSGEADRILTVFTKNRGKIQIKAVGVRKINSRRSPHTEPLNYTLLYLYKGRGIPILIEAETLEAFPRIKDNLKRIGYAYYLCELIDCLCPENQENISVFYLLSDTLKKLSKEEDFVRIINEFEKSLLTTLGFYPQNILLSQDIDLSYIIEQIIEKKLKTKQIISRLTEKE